MEDLNKENGEQLFIIKKLNKKQKESFIHYGFFIIIFLITILTHSFLRWNHYRDNTVMASREIERNISVDNINNPDPKKEYFYKIQIVKVKRTNGFMRVKVTKTENNLGSWSRDKI